MALIPVFIRDALDGDVTRHYLCQAEPGELDAIIAAVERFDVGEVEGSREDATSPGVSGAFFLGTNGKAGFEVIVS